MNYSMLFRKCFKFLKYDKLCKNSEVKVSRVVGQYNNIYYVEIIINDFKLIEID